MGEIQEIQPPLLLTTSQYLMNAWWCRFLLTTCGEQDCFFPRFIWRVFLLHCESGSWSRNKECILFFFQAFPQRFSILSIMMTWIMMFFFFVVFQVCFIFLHFPYYVNAKSRCLLLHLILFVFVIKTIYIYIIDKIINMEKHMEIPRKSSWIRS